MSVTKPKFHIHVIGAGLIGTSIALASKEKGYTVTLEDADPKIELFAQDLIKNHSQCDPTAEDLVVVVAVPPLRTARVVAAALSRYSKSIVIDVASAKTKVRDEVELLSEDPSRFIPTHPVAGREVGGAKSAQSDLFSGRAWAVTPTVHSKQEHVDTVIDFISKLGATVYLMDPQEHDQVFARISHLPQLMSSALASLLQAEQLGIQVAGQGLRDVTRLAESDSSLWKEIVEANQVEVFKTLKLFRGVIDRLIEGIEKGNFESIANLIDEGRIGRQRISGKHGSKPRSYSIFHIVIDDRPGVLGELFSLMASNEINVEDLNIEHSPNQETGLISIAVSPEQESKTSSALQSQEWTFHLGGSSE